MSDLNPPPADKAVGDCCIEELVLAIRERRPAKTMNLGDFVKPVVPPDRELDNSARGRIVAVEVFTDIQASKTWVYVRWFDPDGEPQSEPKKHDPRELEPA